VPHRKSRAQAEIESRLQVLDPQSFRFAVLSAARDFRASWVELGDILTQVREKETYRDWGYGSFEAYCRRELRLKSETANKLTRSYGYVRNHRPAVLDDGKVCEVPALDVVDLLSRARERAKLSENDFRTIEQEVFSPEGPSTRGQLLRRFREIDPEAFGPEKKPASAGASSEVEVRKALLLAERLLFLLESIPHVSDAAREGVRRASRELKQRFENRSSAGAAT
jgi:hypothetical protein